MLAPYRTLFALPGVPRLVFGSIVGRIPYGMTSLGVLLLVRDATGSFGPAGAVVAANMAASCVGGPVQGRLIDRVGQSRVLVACAVLQVGALVVLVSLRDAPVWALAVCAAAAGAFVPPLSPALRTLWPGLVERGGADRAVLQTAYAFEAVAIEVLFVVGPLLAAVLIAVASPATVVLVAGAFTLTGSLVFAGAEASRRWVPTGTPHAHWLGPLRSPSVVALLLVAIPHGAAVGLIEVGLPAYAQGAGARELAGVLIAAWSIGSLAGGLYYGAQRFSGPAARRLVLLHLALAACVAPLALGGGIAPMTAFCLLAGLPMSSAAACLYALLADVAPAGGETEANTWLISGIIAGLAIGGALSGVLVEADGATLAFAASAGVFVVAAAVAQGAARVLRPVAAPAGAAPVRSAT